MVHCKDVDIQSVYLATFFLLVLIDLPRNSLPFSLSHPLEGEQNLVIIFVLVIALIASIAGGLSLEIIGKTFPYPMVFWG